MVLKTLALVLLVGCGQSLFDNHGDRGDGGGNGDGNGSSGDGAVPTSCPVTCLGDAGADFPSARGWQYFDDLRTRTWTPMALAGAVYTGAGSNKITSCSGSSPACAALPGALLVSSTGATSAADPALAFTVATAQVVQLSVNVHVPSGSSAQQVRLYRNSREDVLATGDAMPGVTYSTAITVDALANDRFLLSVAPTAMGAADVGVQFFVSATGAVFPSKCQFAVPFTTVVGMGVDNACATTDVASWFDTGTSEVMQTPTLGPGPFPELGMAADIALDHWYEPPVGTVLDKTGDTTIQLWMKHDAFSPGYAAFAFSDVDLNSPFGGVSIYIYDANNPRLWVSTCTADTPSLMFTEAPTPYPQDAAWHFVRVVHSGGMVKVCLDGKLKTMFAVPAGKLASVRRPYIGRNVRWTPLFATFDGGIDDVRVFTGALPCE